MYKIIKQFSFEAAHSLKGMPPGHQCADTYESGEPRIHGHSYRVEVVLESSRLDARGFVIDYGELDEFATYLKSTFDHRNLNVVVPEQWFSDLSITQTSAENLARGFFVWCKKLWSQTSEVRVSETQKTWSIYRP